MVQPALSYFLVGTPRTGSSLLAQALTGTGCLGRPEEYFWRLQEGGWAERLGVPAPDDSNYERYVSAVVDAATTPNAVFAAKLFWAHLHDLLAHMAHFAGLGDLPEQDRFRAVFGADVRAVFVRRSCLRSALSLWRAEETGVWTERSGDPRPRPPETLDVWRVTTLHADLHSAEIGWPHFLRIAGVPYLTVQYNAIVSDTKAVVRRIADFLGVELPEPFTPGPSVLRRQADEVTERFVDEWTNRTGGCSLCESLEG